MKNLASAVRNLESAMQYADETNDDNLLRSLARYEKDRYYIKMVQVWDGKVI